jgi:hypothetical protein
MHSNGMISAVIERDKNAFSVGAGKGTIPHVMETVHWFF